MIHRIHPYLLFVGWLILSSSTVMAQTSADVDPTEELKSSLVHLYISKYPYDQYRPWKNLDLKESEGFGCVVDDHLVLTTAYNVTDSVLIKARIHGRNDYIPCRMKIVDYQLNLCLIEMDPGPLQPPLKPIRFVNTYRKGAPTEYYWLQPDGEVFSGRGYLDRAELIKSPVSFEQHLNLIAANISQDAGRGELFFMGADPIGIGCRQSDKEKEAGLIPAETILAFLDSVQHTPYQGFGTVGFETTELLDPVQRAFLKLPDEVTSGVYISATYTLGAGSEVLQSGDVLLDIDGQGIDAHGNFQHDLYHRLLFHHLINSKPADSPITFHIWRDGQAMTLSATVKTFQADDMLIPYHDYGKQPEYLITAGFVFQKLTRSYMQQIGDKWYDKISPHLFDYYRNQAFNPSDQRRDIVILSYVLPADINQGYHSLRQIVVKTFNGMPITSISDLLKAQQLRPDTEFHTIEFENDNPIVVIPRLPLQTADQTIAQRYGIETLAHIEP